MLVVTYDTDSPDTLALESIVRRFCDSIDTTLLVVLPNEI